MKNALHKILLLSVISFMAFACGQSAEPEEQNTVAPGELVTVTMRVSTGTKTALTNPDNSDVMAVTWAAGDQIFVYNSSGLVTTLSASEAGMDVTFSGTIEAGTYNDLHFWYLGSGVSSAPDAASDYQFSIASQTGAIGNLSTHHLMHATKTSLEITQANQNISGVTMENMMAICLFNLSNHGTEVSVTGVSSAASINLKDGTIEQSTKDTTITVSPAVKAKTYLTFFPKDNAKLSFTSSNKTAQLGANNLVKGTFYTKSGKAITVPEGSSSEVMPDYGTTGLKGIKIGNTIWAPVNCGYDDNHPNGLLYQWGRKFGQACEPEKINAESMSKTDDTEANKEKFGLFNTTNYNWFSGDIDNTLWNGGTKGEKDPCPTGWRVPTIDELEGLIANKSSWQNGYYFSGSTTYSEYVLSVFLPAAGYRDFVYNYETEGWENPAIYYSGGGSYWSSSSTEGGKAYNLGLNTSSVVVRTNELSLAYSVRCIKNNTSAQ